MKAKNKTKEVKKVKKTSFFKQVIQELKKVSWPDRKYLLKYTIVTLAAVLIFSAYSYLFFVIMSALKVKVGA